MPDAPAFRLVALSPSGAPVEPLLLTELADQVCTGNAAHFERVGYLPPWISYLAVAEGDAHTPADTLLGTCAFKGPPAQGAVEIAYFTFPEFEGRGVATAMARQLLALAQASGTGVAVTARTLPEENASTRILTRLGFARDGMATDDEVGEVWCWRLAVSQ